MAGRRILLGVTGGIAAYKTAELVRLFKKAGAEVRVVMTPDASRFVTPLTLGTLSENEVHTEIFPENEAGSWTKHVALGLWADLFLVANIDVESVGVTGRLKAGTRIEKPIGRRHHVSPHAVENLPLAVQYRLGNCQQSLSGSGRYTQFLGGR